MSHASPTHIRVISVEGSYRGSRWTQTLSGCVVAMGTDTPVGVPDPERVQIKGVCIDHDYWWVRAYTGCPFGRGAALSGDRANVLSN